MWVESTDGWSIPSLTAINAVIVFHVMISSWNGYAYNHFIECIDLFNSSYCLEIAAQLHYKEIDIHV